MLGAISSLKGPEVSILVKSNKLEGSILLIKQYSSISFIVNHHPSPAVIQS